MSVKQPGCEFSKEKQFGTNLDMDEDGFAGFMALLPASSTNLDELFDVFLGRNPGCAAKVAGRMLPIRHDLAREVTSI